MGRYGKGTRVRVRVVPEFRNPYSDIWLYENSTGKVLSSDHVATYWPDSCNVDTRRPYQVLQEEYTVLLDTGMEIVHVAEECLEEADNV